MGPGRAQGNSAFCQQETKLSLLPMLVIMDFCWTEKGFLFHDHPFPRGSGSWASGLWGQISGPKAQTLAKNVGSCNVQVRWDGRRLLEGMV